MGDSHTKQHGKWHNWCHFPLMLGFLICFSILFFSKGFTVPSSVREPFLRVGEWYIFPTTSQFIYLSNNDLLVSTELVKDLLGIPIRQHLGTVQIQYQQSTLNMRVGQKQASLDGKPIVFSVAPAQKGEAILIPLGSALEALDIKWSWEHGSKVFAVTDGRILNETLNPKGIPRLRGNFELFLSSGLPTNNMLVPISFQWDQATQRYHLTIAPAIGVSDLTRAGASILFDMGDQFVYAGDGIITPSGPQKNDCIRKTKTIECSSKIRTLLTTPKWVFVRIWGLSN